MTLDQRTNFGSAEYRKYIWKDNEVSFKRRKRLLLAGFQEDFMMEIAFICSLKHR